MVSLIARASGAAQSRRWPVALPRRVAADGNTVLALNVNTIYGYDAFNRLASAVETPVGSGTPNWTQAYTYDAYGNRAASGYIPYPSLTPQNLAAYTGNRWMPGGIGYDNNGNQNVMQQSSFTYDAENRVRTGTVPGVSAIAYAYDGAGQRVQKTIGSSTTTYVYDAMGELAAEYGAPTDSGTTYLTADTLGSTRLLTNSSGAVKKRYDYFPFGEDIQANLGRSTEDYGSGMYPSPPGVQALDFTGKERDAETGLDYFGARYFSGAQGRFTSSDPLGPNLLRVLNPQRWNMYAYAVNNPLSFVDPDGRDAIAVNFEKEIPKGGHEGFVSVDKNGQATYARFGPVGGSKPSGEGQVTVKDLTPLTFRSDELPTDSAYATLIKEVAVVEGQDPSTVRLNYFKTSETESIAMKSWIERIHAASKARRAPAYDVTKQNCATFTICGLIAGNAIRPDAKISLVPNWLFELLSVPSAENYSHGVRSRPKEKVPDAESTFKPCGPGNPYCP